MSITGRVARTRTFSFSAVVALVVALVGAVMSPVPGQASASSALEYVAFEVTGKVRCEIRSMEYDGAEVRCDAQGATFEVPERPSDCPLEWGSSITMDTYTGPRFACVGDALMTGDALSPGESRSLGDITCTAFADGVTCRVAGGYGFTLTPQAWTWHPRLGTRLISPGKIGDVKVGMTLKAAKRRGAIRRDRSKMGCGGVAAHRLKPRYQGAYVVWRRNRVHSIVAWSGASALTSEGVGVGSSYADARLAYPDAVVKEVSWPYNATALVVRRGKNLMWMFFSPGFEERPWAGMQLELIVTSRGWRPRMELDYHGCGYGV